MKPEDLLLHHHTQNPKLTTGCATLDRLLEGGIPLHQITEIFAESGTGKTQLSLQLLLSSQFPSLYLHSEFPFPFRRLHHLSTVHQTCQNPLDRIFIHPLHSADHLLDVLPKLDSLVPRLGIKLIVIDSIAALFRGEFENTPVELRRRSGVFFKVASRLRFYAQKFGMAVVVTNQVVDVIGGSGLRVGNAVELWSSGRRVCAALGLSWANCVNTRLFMWREEERVGEGGGEDEGFGCVRTRRFVRVIFAPHLPDRSCEFVIRREGVFGVDG